MTYYFIQEPRPSMNGISKLVRADYIWDALVYQGPTDQIFYAKTPAEIIQYAAKIANMLRDIADAIEDPKNVIKLEEE